MSEESIVLNETIHQSTRLRIMTLLVSRSDSDRVAYGFVQKALGLTGGNLTIHLRKLEEAGYVSTTKEFLETKPAHLGGGDARGPAAPSPSTSATSNAPSTCPSDSRTQTPYGPAFSPLSLRDAIIIGTRNQDPAARRRGSSTSLSAGHSGV